MSAEDSIRSTSTPYLLGSIDARLAGIAMTLDRLTMRLDDLERRVESLERSDTSQSVWAKWVERGAWAMLVAAAAVVARKLGVV